MKIPAKKILFALTPLLVLLLLGETAARFKLYFQHGRNTYYLFMPLSNGTDVPPGPVDYKLHVVHHGDPRGPSAGQKETNAGGPSAGQSIDQAWRKEYDLDKESWYYKMTPGVYAAPAPYTAHYRINSLGFRGQEFDPQAKASGITRIFCVGESNTFGMESADDETWPARLASYLAKQKQGAYEVINAGFDGYTSLNMRNLVLKELSHYQPDMLVIYAGLNDLNFENAVQERTASSVATAVHRFLYYRWSMLYTLLIEKASVVIQKNPVPMIGYEDKAKETFARNMAAIMSWCKSQGVRCVVVREMVYSIPSLFVRDSLSLQEAQRGVSNGSRDAWGAEYAPPSTLSRHSELMGLLKELCAAHGVPFLDVRRAMYEALTQGKRLMYDFGHLTPEANDILAREIARRLS